MIIRLSPAYDAFSRCWCDENSYGTPADGCVMCPANTYSPAGAARVMTDCTCSAGFYPINGFNVTANASTLTCAPCATVNGYAPAGAAACTMCPANAIIPPGGSGRSVTDCVCIAGYFPATPMPTPGTNATWVCAPCPANTFKPSIGQTACTLCGEGQYAPPASTTCFACASSGVMCDPGRVQLRAGWYPLSIAEGYPSDQVSLRSGVNPRFLLQPEDGLPNVPLNDSFAVCTYPPACTVSADGLVFQCADGHTGPLCGSCQPGFTRALSPACTACPSTSTSIALMALNSIFFSLYCVFFIAQHMRARQRSAMVSARILLQHVSVLSLLVRDLTAIPTSLREMLWFLLYVDVNAVLTSPLQCLLRVPPDTAAGLMLALPGIYIMLGVTAFLLASRCRRTTQDIWSGAESAITTVLFILWPGQLRWVLSSFSYVLVRDVRVLASDTMVRVDAVTAQPGMHSFTPVYRTIAACAIAVGVLYIVLVPTIAYVRLCMRVHRVSEFIRGAVRGMTQGDGAKDSASSRAAFEPHKAHIVAYNLADPDVRTRFAWMSTGMRAPAVLKDGSVVDTLTYAWNVVILLRQCVVVVIIAVPNTAPLNQVTALCMWLLACLAAQLYAWPYSRDLHNYMETASIVVHLLTLWPLLLLLQTATDTATLSSAAALAMSVWIAVMSITFVAVVTAHASYICFRATYWKSIKGATAAALAWRQQSHERARAHAQVKRGLYDASVAAHDGTAPAASTPTTPPPAAGSNTPPAHPPQLMADCTLVSRDACAVEAEAAAVAEALKARGIATARLPFNVTRGDEASDTDSNDEAPVSSTLASPAPANDLGARHSRVRHMQSPVRHADAKARVPVRTRTRVVGGRAYAAAATNSSTPPGASVSSSHSSAGSDAPMMGLHALSPSEARMPSSPVSPAWSPRILTTARSRTRPAGVGVHIEMVASPLHRIADAAAVDDAMERVPDVGAAGVPAGASMTVMVQPLFTPAVDVHASSMEAAPEHDEW